MNIAQDSSIKYLLGLSKYTKFKINKLLDIDVVSMIINFLIELLISILIQYMILLNFKAFNFVILHIINKRLFQKYFLIRNKKRLFFGTQNVANKNKNKYSND